MRERERGTYTNKYIAMGNHLGSLWARKRQRERDRDEEDEEKGRESTEGERSVSVSHCACCDFCCCRRYHR